MAKSRDTTLSALDRSPGHLLHRVLQLALDLYGEEVGPAGLSQRQFAVRCAVAADEGVSQTGLVRATGIDRSTMADIVSRMIAGQLLIRERSAVDARLNLVRTTEMGRAALTAAEPCVAKADQRLLDRLGPKKRAPFFAALRRLAKATDAQSPTEADTNDASAEAKPDRPKKLKKAGKKKKAKAGSPPALDESPKP